ncbi:TnsA endonuclease N-terminal domain-containing protein [Duganella sp. sic0402]|uniref:TnsA endonuclease N-terminal domain-containing protein n=1 Tax=Duganella sp. sic0402 TaxID=2854786 RepID=UPI001C45F52F|nr:TnsA endonuclease N-terminal domain-containing protein [Duganella sp. sic0402]MBV7539402.1 TnsA endonuclease N-terminal domain-containing protein [Duganella sp. sic0402]
MVAWESLLERDAIILFELSPGVVSYEEQPSVEIYYDDSSPRKYFPDFAVTLRNGSVAHVEVKPAEKLKGRTTRARFSLIAAQYERQARQFWILTDDEIRKEPRLSNLKLLAYHRRETLMPLHLDTLLSALEPRTSASFADFSEVFGGPTLVFRLLAAGLLTCDLNEPIQNGTAIHTTFKGAPNDSLFF